MQPSANLTIQTAGNKPAPKKNVAKKKPDMKALTLAQLRKIDDMRDAKSGIKENSKADMKQDAKLGIKD